MNEILKLINALSADELDGLIMRANIILENKRKEEAEAALREKERLRQEMIAQERKRQQEIVELQRKLQELQNQKIAIPDEPVQGEAFVMYDSPRPVSDAYATPAPAKPLSPQPAPAQPRPAPAKPAPQQPVCPYCRALNAPGSVFCASCGQRLDGKPAPQPASAPQPAPVPQSTPEPQPVQYAGEGVRYFTESEKEWKLAPGERQIGILRQDIQLIQPAPASKMSYTMMVTDRRIIIECIGSFAKNVGLVGGIAAEMIRNAGGKGYKPWVEIPMAAITRYGVNEQNQFVIEAGETFVFKNKGYVKKLADVIAQAKSGGR